MMKFSHLSYQTVDPVRTTSRSRAARGLLEHTDMFLVFLEEIFWKLMSSKFCTEVNGKLERTGFTQRLTV